MGSDDDVRDRVAKLLDDIEGMTVEERDVAIVGLTLGERAALGALMGQRTASFEDRAAATLDLLAVLDQGDIVFRELCDVASQPGTQPTDLWFALFRVLVAGDDPRLILSPLFLAIAVICEASSPSPERPGTAIRSLVDQWRSGSHRPRGESEGQ